MSRVSFRDWHSLADSALDPDLAIEMTRYSGKLMNGEIRRKRGQACASLASSSLSCTKRPSCTTAIVFTYHVLYWVSKTTKNPWLFSAQIAPPPERPNVTFRCCTAVFGTPGSLWRKERKQRMAAEKRHLGTLMICTSRFSGNVHFHWKHGSQYWQQQHMPSDVANHSCVPLNWFGK